MVAPDSRGCRKPHEAVDDPSRAVAVLPAVLAHAGRIVGDAAGIGLRMLVERRLEQQDSVRTLNPLEPALDRRERAFVVASPGMDGPAGRHGVARADLATI